MSVKNDLGRRFLYFLLKPLIKVLAWKIYRVKLSKAKKIKGQHLVLCNHSSLVDSALVSSMFSEPIYFVAASFLVKSKFWGKLLQKLTGIIPIDKSGFDIKALRTVLKYRSAGRSIGVFPEGNNSISGAPLYFGIGIAKLAKQLKLPVALCNGYGGYLTHPKWALYGRRGSVEGKVVRIISKDEVKELPMEELYRIIRETLYIDAYQEQEKDKKVYKGKNLSEGISALFYLCSECKGEGTIKSTNEGFECTKCGAKMRYNEYGYIEGSRFYTTRDWDSWQLEEIMSYAKNKKDGELVYSMDDVKLIDFTGEDRIFLESGTLKLYTDKIVLGNHSMPIKDIQGTALHYVNGVLITTTEGKNFGYVHDDPHIPGLQIWYAIDALRGVISQNKSGLRLPAVIA